MKWNVLPTNQYVCLEKTLNSGQVFNFVQTDDNEYTGAIHFFIVSLKQSGMQIFYKILATKNDNEKLIECMLLQFFTQQLDYNCILDEYDNSGLRLVTNNLIQTLFTFICSSNNNVKRIGTMVKYLYSKGTYACNYKEYMFYFFPDIKELVDIQDDLKKAGFGYRSKYITETARHLCTKIEYKIIITYDKLTYSMLHKELDNKINFSEIMKAQIQTTRNEEGDDKPRKGMETHVGPKEIDIRQVMELYEKAEVSENVMHKETTINEVKHIIKDRLKHLPGIGPKVRDCICLMGLGMYEIVPIDTHIYKHAKAIFGINFPKLTNTNYGKIQKLFINKYGMYAGVYQLFIFKMYIDKSKIKTGTDLCTQSDS